MKTGKILAIFGLIASTFSIFVKVMTPTTVQFIFDGTAFELNMIPEIYTSFDVTVTGISCFIMGVCLVYLWVIGKNEQNPAEPKTFARNWVELLNKTSNPEEQKIISLVIDEGGTMFQSQLVEKSGYSKTKVSLILDRLEAKKILERRRHGMTNVVVLK